jgi:flavin reductase (DIM6/NTAB) family NADH-FMN oxidoreductase RutF
VAVVTGVDSDSRPVGLTASAASYSVSPPSVITCIDDSNRSFHGLTQGDQFTVNFLNEQQGAVATLFASKATDKFEQSPCTRWGNGLFVIQDALVSLICQQTFMTTHGDHAIVIGRVVDGCIKNHRPLVYWQRNFHSIRDVHNG